MEALGTLLDPWGAFGEVWRGLKMRSKKGTLQSHACDELGGGVPIRNIPKEDQDQDGDQDGDLDGDGGWRWRMEDAPEPRTLKRA